MNALHIHIRTQIFIDFSPNKEREERARRETVVSWRASTEIYFSRNKRTLHIAPMLYLFTPTNIHISDYPVPTPMECAFATCGQCAFFPNTWTLLSHIPRHH